MDAIARKRGSAAGDSSGVRDSVVNQLLAKMDGVKEAANVLVVGLTNRPELLDDALLRPGRLEVKLEVSLPDQAGRRDILRIHTRSMRENGALAEDAACFVDVADEACSVDAASATGLTLAEQTEHFSGAELAGLVRSAASFALGRAAVGGAADVGGVRVDKADFEAALSEVRPARGRRDEAMARRFAIHGVDAAVHTSARASIRRLVSLRPSPIPLSPVRGALLVPESAEAGDDAVALAAWAGFLGGTTSDLAHVRIISLGEIVSSGGGTSEEGRCAALVERFNEARAMRRSMLILEDADLLLAAPGAKYSDEADADPPREGAISRVLLGTLRSLLREAVEDAAAGSGEDEAVLIVLATLSTPDATGPLRKLLGGLASPLIPVQLIHSAEEAADAIRSSTALGALLAPKAIELISARAVAQGPVSMAALREACACACAEAAWDSEGPEATDLGAAQVRAFGTFHSLS